MSVEDDSFYIPAKGLKAGMFVDLELRWIDHPFAFSRFVVKTDKDISTIQRLKPGGIKVIPSRSFAHVLFTDTSDNPAGTPDDQPEPDPELQAMLEEKRIREERSAKLRKKRREANHEYREKSNQIRHLTSDLKTKPANAIHDLDTLVDDLAAKFGDSENLLTRLVDLSNQEYSDVHHTTNVTILSLMLGSSLGIDGEGLKRLGSGAMLHDIGKINIPVSLRHKSNPSETEAKIIQAHPGYGRTLVERVRDMHYDVLDIISKHHEYLDGSGYPDGLSGEQISQMVRIVSIANYYDNLCNPPELDFAMTPKSALAILYRDYNTRLDSELIAHMIEILGIYPPGSVVQLTDDQVGLVIAAKAGEKMQPDIMIYDPDVPKDEAVIIRLSEYPDVSIERALKPGEYPPEIHDYLGIQERIGYFVSSQLD